MCFRINYVEVNEHSDQLTDVLIHFKFIFHSLIKTNKNKTDLIVLYILIHNDGKL